MTIRVELSDLFARAGITEEEFRKYFLEPLYPNQNPSIIDGIVYTDESDDDSDFVRKVEREHIIDLLGEFQDLFLTVFTERGLDKKVFIEWMAYQSAMKSANPQQLQLQKNRDARQQSPSQPQQQSRSQAPSTNITPQQEQRQQQSAAQGAAAASASANIGAQANTDSSSAIANAARGLRNVVQAAARRLRGMFPSRRRRDDNSRRGEGRDLAREQKDEKRDIKDSGIKESAEAKVVQTKEQTKDLAKELNILDAVYDNVKFVIEMRRLTDAMVRDKTLSAQEMSGAQALSSALRNPEHIKGMELTSGNEMIIQYNNQASAALRQSTSVIRLTGRLGSLAASFSRAAIALQTDSLKDALSSVGSLALGKGGKDVKGIESDETHNQKAAEKLKNLQNKSKEI